MRRTEGNIDRCRQHFARQAIEQAGLSAQSRLKVSPCLLPASVADALNLGIASTR